MSVHRLSCGPSLEPALLLAAGWLQHSYGASQLRIALGVNANQTKETTEVLYSLFPLWVAPWCAVVVAGREGRGGGRAGGDGVLQTLILM